MSCRTWAGAGPAKGAPLPLLGADGEPWGDRAQLPEARGYHQ
jgi:hypothetical protein